MSTHSDPSSQAPHSTTADALAAAGDQLSARDIGALDAAALGVEKKLAATRSGLVERLIYGPAPSVAELQSGGRLAMALDARQLPAVDAAMACLAAGQAFTADGKLSDKLRSTVAADKAYGFTIPVDFGGAGGSYLELARMEEALAANGLGPLAVEISGELTIGAGSLLAYGSDEQRKTYLPMIAEGRLMGFALTEVAVGVNAKKIQAYVEEDGNGDFRLYAEGARNKLWITNAHHGALMGIVARMGQGGDRIGLFVVQLPEQDVGGVGADYEFRCEASNVAAFTANHNSRLHFRNFPIPAANRIPADGVEVLFYCLRMGRCMLAAMSAGYQLMLARDASYYAIRRLGVGGPVIKHELPRLALGKMLGGALQARALAYLSLQQDADNVDLAGLRDLTKSAAASAGLESMIACEHVLGGRSFDGSSRVNAARVNLHLFGVVEGEDDMIRMGMVRDVTQRFVKTHLAALLDVLRNANKDADGNPVDASQRLLRIGPASCLRAPGRSASAVAALLKQRGFWRLAGWAVRQACLGLLRLPLRLVPGALLPRYVGLPAPLRHYARFAERKLRGLRWTYLGLSLIYQLELTRAQIPLQRLGLCIEHLVSMLAVCHHAGIDAAAQTDVAVLQAQLLKDKYDAVKLLGSLRDTARLRRATAALGQRIQDGDASLFKNVEAEPFAHPWDEEKS
jgi:alkylation response protein AidB-like acyl-CoA dehydrogenase